MAENLINPLHNVHKKYRTMNFVNHYIFTPPVDLSVNTEIGGVAASINTPQLLATKLAIDVSRITNFSIIGSDIKCRITGSYVVPSAAFLYEGTPSFTTPLCTYYKDKEGLVTSVGIESFKSSVLKWVHLKNCTSVGDAAFAGDNVKEFFYLPSCQVMGANTGNNSVFAFNLGNPKIYVNNFLATNNGGAADVDLTSAITRGATISYVLNFTSPSPITNLSIGNVFATTMQFNFTSPSSANVIDYYEIWLNGVDSGKTVKSSGQYVTGFVPNTYYEIKLNPVDVFFNKSTSNTVTQTTSNTSYTDADAIAYVSAASLTSSEQESAYKLITDLKTNNLWNKIQAIYPFKGTTAAQHKWNAKNPLDTNAAFRLTFTGAATFSNLGYQLNGSSYANTYLTPSVTQTLNSNGMTVVCGTNIENSGDNWAIASYNSGTQNSILSIIGNGAMNLNGTRLFGGSALGQIGVFTATKQSATVSKLFKNNVQKITGNSGGTLPTNPFYIGAIGNIAYGYIKERIQMAIIHEGLSDAEVATLHSIIDLSESIAGRKTW